MVMAPWMGMIDLKDNTMKITKQRLKQIIREELEAYDEALGGLGAPVTTMDFEVPDTITGDPDEQERVMDFEPEEMVVDLADVDQALHGDLEQLANIVSQRAAKLPEDDPRLGVYSRVAETLISLLK